MSTHTFDDDQEDVDPISDLFKILITPMQVELIDILKDKLFDKLRSKYFDLVVATNNEQSIVQPHNHSELDSIRIIIRTQRMHSHQSVHNFIQLFLVEFFDLYANNTNALQSILPHITIYKNIRKDPKRHIHWATFGGDHQPRFTPGMNPDLFSQNYKIHRWAVSNIDKTFDTFDSFVIGKGESKQNSLRRYLDRVKFKATFKLT